MNDLDKTNLLSCDAIRLTGTIQPSMSSWYIDAVQLKATSRPFFCTELVPSCRSSLHKQKARAATENNLLSLLQTSHSLQTQPCSLQLKSKLILDQTNHVKLKNKLLTNNKYELEASSCKGINLLECNTHFNMPLLKCTNHLFPQSSRRLINPMLEHQHGNLASPVRYKNSNTSETSQKHLHMTQDLMNGSEEVDEVYRCLGDDFPASICWNKSLDTILLTFPQCEESASDYRPPEKDYAAKIQLIRVVSSSLIVSLNFSKRDEGPAKTILELLSKIAAFDPEFNLKVALYARQDLNIRTTSNFILACCACIPECRPYLKKYFCASIQLPSDWIDVAEKSVNLRPDCNSLPSALRKVLVMKFSEFDEYQLAKYNKTDSSNKKKKKKQEVKKQADAETETEVEAVTTEAEENVKEVEIRQCFTLKKLIASLHIVQPAYHVMCLLGKKYPDSVENFYKSGLEGTWDSTLAGKRMKLKVPNTWETQLSAKGNNAKAWETLLDDKAVPYMATLRNIRNMIKVGIDEKHHNTVIRFLTNKRAVMQSRQFPFRFFSAYEVLDDMEKELNKQRLYAKKGASAFLSKQLLEVHEKAKKKYIKPENRTDEVKQLYSIKSRLEKKYGKAYKYNEEILNRYRKALNAAVETAAQYNVSPIKGRTLILCEASARMNVPCMGTAKTAGKRTLREIAILLALMCAHSCEAYTLVVFCSDKNWKPMKIEKGGILSNSISVMEYAQCMNENSAEADSFISMEFLSDIVIQRQTYDSCLLLSKGLSDLDQTMLTNFLERYRYLVNKDLLHYEIDLSGKKLRMEQSEEAVRSKNVKISGFSSQILRYVAEGDAEAQIAYVNNIDKLKNLPQMKSAIPRPLAVGRLAMADEEPRSFQTFKVFISSTFEDMSGERDILVNYVFPELRKKAAQYNALVTECDFRWGIPAAGKSQRKVVEICLEEIEKCHFFIGLVGNRYGWVPKRRDLPVGRHWEDYLGKSITEIEMLEGGLNEPTSKSFFYIRSSKKLPKKFKDVFAESASKKRKLEALKKNILNTPGVEVHVDYPFEWQVSSKGKPLASNLQQFADTVLADLWSAVSIAIGDDQATDGDDSVDLESKVIRTHQNIAARQSSCFVGQKITLDKCVAVVMETGKPGVASGKGSLICLSGAEGSGKTTMISAVSEKVSAFAQNRAVVLKYFVGCPAHKSDDVKFMLDCFSFQLVKYMNLNDTATVGESFDDTISLFWYFVRMATEQFSRSLFIFIDEPDAFRSSEYSDGVKWIPNDLPPGVAVVFSCTEMKLTHKLLMQRKATVIKIPQLSSHDSGLVIRQILSEHGKSLDEKSFNNQLQKLNLKTDSKVPLYLKLACDYARLFADFSTLCEELDRLPRNLHGLIEHWIAITESHLEVHFGAQGKATAGLTLLLILCCPRGIDEQELFHILCMWSRMIYKKSISWSCFCQTLYICRILLNRRNEEYSTKLSIQRPLYAEVVRKRYLSGKTGKDTERFCHRLIAAFHMTSLSSTNHVVPPHASLTALPFHLSKCDDVLLLRLLSDFNFMEEKCKNKMAHELLDDYSLLGSLAKYRGSKQWSSLWDLYFCLSSSFHLVDRHPLMLYQFAINQQSQLSTAFGDKLTDVREDAADCELILCENLNKESNLCVRTLNDMRNDVPYCLCHSPDEKKVVCGSRTGTLVVFDASSGKRLQVMNAGVGANKIVYVTNDLFVTGHVNGKLTIWNDENGVLVVTMNHHRQAITDMTFNPTLKYLACVSRDRWASVWQLAANLESSSHPLGKYPFVKFALDDVIPNCVDMHPLLLKLAVGLWDGSIRAWEVSTGKRVAIMRGSPSSVTCLKYSSCGTYIFSSSLHLAGVNVWFAATGTLIGLLGNKYVVDSMERLRGRGCLVAAGRNVGNRCDATIAVWKESMGKNLGSFVFDGENQGSALCCGFNNNQTKVAIGYHKGCLALYDVTMQKTLAQWKNLHKGPITCLCWGSMRPGDSDFEFVVTGSNDNLIHLIFAETDNLVHTFSGHEGSITALACHESHVASASVDCTIILWFSACLRASSGATLDPTYVLRAHEAPPTCLSFNSEGTRLVSGGKDKKMIYWNLPADPNTTSPEMKPYRVVNNAHRDWLTTCCYSDVNDHVATGSNDCFVRIWDGSNRLYEFRRHSSYVTSVSYQLGCVLSSDTSGVTHLWSHRGIEISTAKFSARINCAALAVSLRSNKMEDVQDMEQTDWATQVEYEEWQDAHESKVMGSKPSKKTSFANLESMHVVAAFDNGETMLWAPLQSNELLSLTGHTGVISSLSSATSSLASCSNDGSIKFWDVSGLQTSYEATSDLRHESEVTVLVISGHFLFSACAAGHLKIWLLRGYSGNPLMLQNIKGHEGRITGITLIESSKPIKKNTAIIFASSSFDGFIKIWKFDKDVGNIKSLSKFDVKNAISFLSFDKGSIVFGTANGNLNKVCYSEEDDFRDQSVLTENSSSWYTFLVKRPLRLFVTDQGTTWGRDVELNIDEGAYICACASISCVGQNDVLVTGDNHGCLYLSHKDFKRKIHGDRITAILSFDNYILTTSFDRTVKVWKKNNWQQVGLYSASSSIGCAEIHVTTGTLICGFIGGEIQLIRFKQLLQEPPDDNCSDLFF